MKTEEEKPVVDIHTMIPCRWILLLALKDISNNKRRFVTKQDNITPKGNAVLQVYYKVHAADRQNMRYSSNMEIFDLPLCYQGKRY